MLTSPSSVEVKSVWSSVSTSSYIITAYIKYAEQLYRSVLRKRTAGLGTSYLLRE